MTHETAVNRARSISKRHRDFCKDSEPIPWYTIMHTTLVGLWSILGYMYSAITDRVLMRMYAQQLEAAQPLVSSRV